MAERFRIKFVTVGHKEDALLFARFLACEFRTAQMRFLFGLVTFSAVITSVTLISGSRISMKRRSSGEGGSPPHYEGIVPLQNILKIQVAFSAF